MRPHAIAERLLPDAVHQGLYLEVDPLPSPDIENLEAAGVVLVLDQITDPHNVGAILRSAAAFGAHARDHDAAPQPGRDRRAGESGVRRARTCAVVSVQNLARGLTALKDNGFLIVGLDSEGDTDLAAIKLRAPLALVLGAEGKGLRQLTRETCDHVARIDLPGVITSLNVSNAAAVALYVATQKLRG